MSDSVIASVTDGVLTLTLNRPDKRNAIDAATIDGLAEGLARAELERDIRVVVLRGAFQDLTGAGDTGGKDATPAPWAELPGSR